MVETTTGPFSGRSSQTRVHGIVHGSVRRETWRPAECPASFVDQNGASTSRDSRLRPVYAQTPKNIHLACQGSGNALNDQPNDILTIELVYNQNVSRWAMATGSSHH